ncbi:MAG: hypothetical protein ACTSU5_03270 [Promethearchaeota archaeon]
MDRVQFPARGAGPVGDAVGQGPIEGRETFYFCHERACSRPTTDRGEFQKLPSRYLPRDN